MIKSIFAPILIVFSLVAIAEITKVNGWAMATLFQRVCIIWSIGVLFILLYQNFRR